MAPFNFYHVLSFSLYVCLYQKCLFRLATTVNHFNFLGIFGETHLMQLIQIFSSFTSIFFENFSFLVQTVKSLKYCGPVWGKLPSETFKILSRFIFSHHRFQIFHF